MVYTDLSAWSRVLLIKYIYLYIFTSDVLYLLYMFFLYLLSFYSMLLLIHVFVFTKSFTKIFEDYNLLL